jgi:hypothetical protein
MVWVRVTSVDELGMNTWVRLTNRTSYPGNTGRIIKVSGDNIKVQFDHDGKLWWVAASAVEKEAYDFPVI